MTRRLWIIAKREGEAAKAASPFSVVGGRLVGVGWQVCAVGAWLAEA